jgi:Mg/Co/Ni transporter MgtE
MMKTLSPGLGISHYRVRQSMVDVVSGLGFIVALFAIVVLHELGHALTARRLWMAAEASSVQIKSALGGIPVSKATITDFRSLSPHDSLQQALEHVLAGFQHDFPVVEQGRLVGVLTRGDLLTNLAQKGPQARVEEAMNERFQTADFSEMLELALSRLQNYKCLTLPVLRNGSLAGVLTMDNVGEFLMIQSALRGGLGAGGVRIATGLSQS